ncbi:MAG: hypothetical protein SGJ27_01640 [Candidatus Melainabacteria bacterium]|nr:hypothetical protein [Candidatus Melainabacteria bacterium]
MNTLKITSQFNGLSPERMRRIEQKHAYLMRLLPVEVNDTGVFTNSKISHLEIHQNFVSENSPLTMAVSDGDGFVRVVQNVPISEHAPDFLALDDFVSLHVISGLIAAIQSQGGWPRLLEIRKAHLDQKLSKPQRKAEYEKAIETLKFRSVPAPNVTADQGDGGTPQSGFQTPQS